jgi:hypothetical protein
MAHHLAEFQVHVRERAVEVDARDSDPRVFEHRAVALVVQL